MKLKENGLKAQTKLGQRPDMNINSVRLGLAGSPGSHDDEPPIIYIHGQHFPAKIKRETERAMSEKRSSLNPKSKENWLIPYFSMMAPSAAAADSSPPSSPETTENRLQVLTLLSSPT